jgi:hypothetical protein
MTKTGALKSVHASLRADPFALAAKSAFWLSGAVAVGTLAVAVYKLTPSLSERAAPSMLTADASAERWTPISVAEEPEAEPVRVKNPFDKTEVFEFPSGTTPADARAMMSEILMQRARERYAQLDRRT